MLDLRAPMGGRLLLCILFSLLLSASDASAQLGQWRAHTSMRQATAVAVSEQKVWVATQGGVFSYTPETGEFERYTVVEGLHGVNAQAIAYDARRDCVWIGYDDGALDKLDVQTGTVRTFLAIERAERFTTRQVNRLVVHGDSLLVATAFGLVVFDPVRLEVRDTYSRLGAFTPATPVRDVTVAPSPDETSAFWLATDEGVAYADVAGLNLQDPSTWTNEGETLPEQRDGSGETLPKAKAIAFFDGQIYVGGVDDLYVREAGGAYRPLSVTRRGVQALAATPERLLGVERFRVFMLATSGEVQSLLGDGFQDPLAIADGTSGQVWVGDGEQGLVSGMLPPSGGTRLLDVQAALYPEGPYDGVFSDLTFDSEGNLWAAGVRGTGFYQLDPEGVWTSYTRALVPALTGASYVTIHADPLGNVWAGSNGSGLAEVTAEGELRTYNRTNASLQSSTTANEDFIITDGIGSEADGTLWVTNKVAARPLHTRTPDGTWTSFAPLVGDGLSASMRAYDEVLVDRFGQKWIAVLDELDFRFGRGLIVLDTGGTPTEPGDDLFRFFSDRQNCVRPGLPNTRVNALAEDQDGRIWIGTSGGLAYVINSGVVAQDPSAVPLCPQWADRSQGTFVLFGLAINDVAVDPANRLWVATNEGVRLLEEAEEGWREVVHFTTENAPLVSDRVLAVTVDAQTGRVYFATDGGLLSYGGEALGPAEAARDLTIFPNPVRMDQEGLPAIYIEGLVDGADLRILAPHGDVVARFATRGGRARWDGRGPQGQPVPSGVYLVVAVGQDGEGVAYGKVAVIR
ncbi:MAG: two-component regulator propeller domain-containing protein [Rhodothermales bacterium]